MYHLIFGCCLSSFVHHFWVKFSLAQTHDAFHPLSQVSQHAFQTVKIFCNVDHPCRDSSVGSVPDAWTKGCKFESWQKQQENLLLQSYFPHWLLINICSTIVLPQWHVKKKKKKGPSAKSTSGRLNMHTYLTQQSWCRQTGYTVLAHCGNLSGKQAHSTCQGTLGHSHLSSLMHCGPTLA